MPTFTFAPLPLIVGCAILALEEQVTRTRTRTKQQQQQHQQWDSFIWGIRAGLLVAKCTMQHAHATCNSLGNSRPVTN
jgi:hypothetical protein